MNTDKDKKEHKPLKFGMKVEDGVGGAPFVQSEQNNNPYGDKYFNANPLSVGANEEESLITSIPSPYAPMHLVNVAFMELNAGKGQQGDENFKKRWNNLPNSYKRAISHCLDLYELFYYFVDLDIYENGIKIEKIDLVTKRGEDKKRECEQLLGEGDSPLSRFIDTLDLYRERYITEIKEVRPANYKFDFKTLYVFKDKKGVIFGGTSPFTGFFAKPDCNLSGLETKWKVNDIPQKHKLLTANSADWLPLSQRSFEFKKFMYMLLKDDNDKGTGLGKVFKSLWDTARNAIVVWESDGTENDLKALDLNACYPAFNFSGAGLPKIRSRGEKDLFLRTTDFDKTHMKYLLYLHYPSVDMKVTEEECNEDIENRTFPRGGDVCRWVSVNDLLSDALYILPYEINDNYVAVEYTVKDDPQQKKHRRCLLPIKKDVLKYLDIRTQENTSLLETIAGNITIVQHKRSNQDGTEEIYFVVTMNIALEGLGNSGTDSVVKLRREYCDYYKHPNGIIIGPEKLDYFAFGIYPFVRSDEFENIYKVLFYNNFRSRVQEEKNGFKLEFYHMDNEVPTKYDNGEMKYNCTHSVLQSGYESQKFNSVYYNVEKAKEEKKKSPFVEFVELSYTPEDTNVKATALIVPNLKKIEYESNKKADIAIDLGTSNTYVAYRTDGDAQDTEAIHEICSMHKPQGGGSVFNELVFMNVSPTRDQRTEKGNYFDFDEKYEHDLYLPPLNDDKRTDRPSWTVCMPTQLCEFMPARIVKSGDAGGFSFPIPTVINNYSNIAIKEGDGAIENLPMIHSAIPFAYYDMGKRTNGRDIISDGNFKWCFKSDENEDPTKVNSLSLYINELLFMIRTHLLCEKINLRNCRLVWTYPLSFTGKLLETTGNKWKEAFEKYFGVNVSKENMFKVNESLAPYHSVGANNEFNLLMDIGGGSTDVVGYYNQSPVFVSSFQFAGNALYMTSNKNKDNDADNSMESPTKNIIKKRLQDSTDIKTLFNSRSSYFGEATELIPIGGRLSNVMNYGFTKHHKKFESFFTNATYKLSFLVLFHNAALIYHAAQLCYVKKPNEMPRRVYMAGNGSNLFKLKNEDFGKNLVKRIFKEYYGIKDAEIEVEMLSMPKTAAAEGALKIINDESLMKEATLETQNRGGENGNEIIVYTFGDIDGANPKNLHIEGFDTLSKEYERPDETNLKTMRENLQKNVVDFIELFNQVVCKDMYEKYPEGVTKDWLIKKAKDIKFDNNRLKVGKTITDSYFFNYIAMLMEEVSEVMVRNAK